MRNAILSHLFLFCGLLSLLPFTFASFAHAYEETIEETSEESTSESQEENSEEDSQDDAGYVSGDKVIAALLDDNDQIRGTFYKYTITESMKQEMREQVNWVKMHITVPAIMAINASLDHIDSPSEADYLAAIEKEVEEEKKLLAELSAEYKRLSAANADPNDLAQLEADLFSKSIYYVDYEDNTYMFAEYQPSLADIVSWKSGITPSDCGFGIGVNDGLEEDADTTSTEEEME